MAVAEVPGRARAFIHDAIILFGGPNNAGVLCGIEKFLAVARRILQPVLQKLDKLFAGGLFASFAAHGGITAIACGLVLPGCKASVTRARLPGGAWIHAIQIPKHRGYRSVQAVDIEAAEFDAVPGCFQFVEAAEPFHEFQHFLVAPHPARKAIESPFP